jgi:ribosomal protein L31E
MRKYFLILFGELESEEVCKEIALTLTPLVDSPHLKFNHSKGTLVFHFASDVSQEEIHDYVMGSLFDIVTSFFLIENTDKVSLFLPKKIQEHLLDLQNVSEDVEMTINLHQTRSLDELEKDEEFVALLLDEVKKQIKKPSLDQILDKVLAKGIESLSKFEKDTLDSYSDK